MIQGSSSTLDLVVKTIETDPVDFFIFSFLCVQRKIRFPCPLLKGHGQMEELVKQRGVAKVKPQNVFQIVVGIEGTSHIS